MNTEEIIIKMGLNSGAVNQGIRSVKSEVNALGSHLKGALGGLVGVAAFEELARSTIEYGSKVNDLSLRLGISTDAVQQWDYALKQSGSSIEAAVPFFEKLGIARHEALAGNEEMVAAFTKLGVSMSSLKSDRLEDIAAKIGKTVEIGDPQSLIASLREVGGKGAGQLIAAFRDGLTDMFKDAPIISADNISELDKIGDKFATLKAEFMSGFAPAVTALFSVLNGTLTVLQGVLTASTGAFSGMLEKLTGSDVVDAMRNPGKAAKGAIKGVGAFALKSAANPVLALADLFGAGVSGAGDALDGMTRMEVDKNIKEKEKAERDKKKREKKDFSDPEAEAEAAEKLGKLQDAAWAKEEAERKKEDAELKRQAGEERRERESARKDSLEILKAEAGENHLLYAQQKLDVDLLALAEAGAADDREQQLKLEHELRLDVIELRKQEKKHAEDQAKFDKDIAKGERNLKEATLSPYMPTLNELANSMPWQRDLGDESRRESDQWMIGHGMAYAQKEGAASAQNLERLKDDAKRALFVEGPKSERLKKDLDNIKSLKAGLAEAGLQTSDDHIEEMADHLKTMREKAVGEGLKVQSINAA